MKKILISLLALAAAGTGLFAQEEAPKFQIHGLLSTGLRLSFVQDFKDNYGDAGAGPDHTVWTRINKTPSLAAWHEDHGAVRLELNGSYTMENAGLVFRTMIKPYEWWEALSNRNGSQNRISANLNYGDLRDRVLELLDQGYAWVDFADKKVKMSAGRIKDGSFWFSDGLGVRLDFRPVNGLLFGVLLNTTSLNSIGPQDSDLYWKEKQHAQDDGISNYVLDALMETAFGVQYNHELFSVNAAFRLDSEGDGLEEWDAAGWENRRFGGRPADHESDAGKGMKAFLGFWLRVIPNVPIEITGEFMNLNGFSDFGWVKTAEKVAFTGAAPFYVELFMEQRIFGSHALWSTWGIFNIMHENLEQDKYDAGKTVYVNPMPHLLFQPSGSYPLNDRWTVGMGIPIIIWPDNFFEISVHPWIGYKVTNNAYISGSYKFMYQQYDKTYRSASDIEPWINHHIQIKYEWRF